MIFPLYCLGVCIIKLGVLRSLICPLLKDGRGSRGDVGVEDLADYRPLTIDF